MEMLCSAMIRIQEGVKRLDPAIAWYGLGKEQVEYSVPGKSVSLGR